MEKDTFKSAARGLEFHHAADLPLPKMAPTAEPHHMAPNFFVLTPLESPPIPQLSILETTLRYTQGLSLCPLLDVRTIPGQRDITRHTKRNRTLSFTKSVLFCVFFHFLVSL